MTTNLHETIERGVADYKSRMKWSEEELRTFARSILEALKAELPEEIVGVRKATKDVELGFNECRTAVISLLDGEIKKLL